MRKGSDVVLDAGCWMDQVGSRLWLRLWLWAGILLYMYSGNAPLCCLLLFFLFLFLLSESLR
jgi:hypothetical protein